MEAAAASAARSVSSSQSSPLPSRKQWLAVPEHSVRAAGGEVKQGQELNDVVDFSSIQVDSIVGVDDGMMQQRIHNLSRQRDEMLQMEIELRAQLIAKSEIVEMQNSYDAQFKDQSSVITRLQDQLREGEHKIHELERKMEEKERELHAARLDNEAAWAKEDLLREQNKELATFRRECDSIEGERAHHRQQLHDLQEHIQEKERQLLELQEQQRVAQESMLYKDEQIRDAQAWIARVQEMDVLQSATLQAELRERIEQYNQLWVCCQRQFAEMERAIQQLQLELAGGRGNTATYNGESTILQSSTNEGSQIAANSVNHAEANGGDASNGCSGGLSNGNLENSQQVSSGISSQTNHAASLPVDPSIVGMSSYLQPGQVAAMHPYLLHQQGAGQPLGSHVHQIHPGHFQSVAAVAPFQQWQNQPAATEGPSMTSQNQHSLSQAEGNSSVSEPNYNHHFSMNGQGLQPDYLSNPMNHKMDPNSQLSSTEDAQAFQSVERNYFGAAEAQHSLQDISSQFHETLHLDTLNKASETEVHQNTVNVASNEPESQEVITEQPSSAASPAPCESSAQHLHMDEAPQDSADDAALSTEQTGSMSSAKIPESALLDERSLLACIVRTIPPGGKIRISSTLPNRLGKMLAPLHWHDYKRWYGKLDEFVASHPKLFAIEEDYIQLQEGAQGIIAATAALAKVTAAAAASSPYSSIFPPVAVTPMADTGRVKRIPSLESKPVKSIINNTHPSAIQSQHSNSSGFNVSGSLSNVKILSKSKDPLKVNGQRGSVAAENGAYYDGSGLGNPQIRVANYSRTGANYVGKQQGRTPSAALAPQR